MGDAHSPAEHGGFSSTQKKDIPQVLLPGVDLENLLVMQMAELMDLVHARARRRFKQGLKRSYYSLLKRLRAAKRACDTAAGEKPECIKTHLRNMIILPEMIGSVVGVYNGKVFNQVEIKADMVAHYLGEFSIPYKPVKHGTRYWCH